MSRDRFEDYVTVAERIEQFYSAYPAGRILTSIIEHDREAGFVLIRAEVYRNSEDTMPAATGHAFEVRGESYVNKTSYLENCECVPIETEILTLEGWKSPSALHIGELVLSYDLEQDQMVWTPLERISIYQDQPIVRLYNNNGFEAFCTANHTWPVEVKVSRPQKCYIYRKLKQTCSLKSGDALISAVPLYGGFMPTTVQQAALMGWAICDGWFMRPSANQYYIGLGQSKPQTVKIIQTLLQGVAHGENVYAGYMRTFPTGRTYQCLPSYKWRLSAQTSRDLLAAFAITHESELPKVIPKLSYEAREAMLQAMMLADGTEIGRFGCKNRPWVMDVFTMLCALQGHVALKRQYSSVGEVPLQTLKRSKRIYASHLQLEDAGRAEVWCPTVRFGTWVARFTNGVTILTGNTSSVGRALALLGFEVKRGIASREEMEKSARGAGSKTKTAAPAAAQPATPAAPDNRQASLDAQIKQAWADAGYKPEKLTQTLNKRFKTEGGLDGLSTEMKEQVLSGLRKGAA
ncbi:MAG TPA: hypothetical protein VGC91_19720 [Pyrinomonadaceae bacterium]|jgi:hypothetical protein